MVATRWPGRRASIGLASALGVVILLLQHRTIWVAALAVLALACVWWAIDRPERRRVAIGIGAGALAALAVAVVAAAIAGGAFWDSIKEPVSDQSTVIWRTDGWGELISDNDSPSNVLTGNPSGVGFERVVDAAAIDASAHNLYIDAYVRFGVIGVLLVASLWILLAVRSRLVAAGSGLDRRPVILLLVTQFAFSLTYALDVSQGIVGGLLVCGLGLAVAAQATPAETAGTDARATPRMAAT